MQDKDLQVTKSYEGVPSQSAGESTGHPAALVTAGARRVGRALCLKLASKGFDIVLHYRSSEDDAKRTAAEIESLGRRCYLVQADLSDTTQLQELIPEVIKELPGLAVLVNNASSWKPGEFLDSSIEELRSYMQIHLEAPYILSRDFARIAKRGLIVNIIDSNIVKQKTDHFAYLLSKKSLFDLTMMSAKALAPNIRVNAIAPGAVLVPEDGRKEKYEIKFGKNPLNRSGTPDDVAEALEYLLCAEYVSGQCIYVSAADHLL